MRDDGRRVALGRRGPVLGLVRERVPFAVLATLVGAALVVLAIRLVLVVAATPPSLWTLEFAPVISPGEAGAASSIATGLSGWISDLAIARTLIMDCAGPAAARSDTFERCLRAVDYGLAAAPTSAELWVERARLLASRGIFDDRMAGSLANSYATAPREGWIAAFRLPFVLRMRAFLPTDFEDRIGLDIQTVLRDRALAGPLIAAYIADPFLREATFDLIVRFASFDQQEMLIGWIRGAL